MSSEVDEQIKVSHSEIGENFEQSLHSEFLKLNEKIHSMKKHYKRKMQELKKKWYDSRKK